MSAIRTRTALRRFLIATVALLMAILGVMPAAQAHDYLVGSTPKPNSTITTAPNKVTLKFNDIVLTRPAPPQLSVRGPDGRYYETGCANVTDTSVVVPVRLGGAGKYTLTWRIVSADGHPVSNSISFTYRPKGRVTGATGITAPKACTVKAAGAGSANRAGESSNGGVPTGAVIAVVVIVIVGVGGAALILLTRGRRHSDEMYDDDDRDDERDDERED